MGDSAPPPAAIDLIDSFARLRGNLVEIVLRTPTEGRDADQLVLRQGRTRLVAEVRLTQDGEGEALIATVARRDLTDGTWAIRLRSADGPRREVEARLLVQAERPLVLLWGSQPAGAGTSPISPTTRSRVLRRSAADAAGRLLGFLPPAVGLRAMDGLRSAARRTTL